MRKSRPKTVTLGDLQEHVDARVRSGAYASASEVLRAGLRALDREEQVLEAWMRRQIEEALKDPSPDVPAEEVFAALRAHHRDQVKAGKRES